MHWCYEGNSELRPTQLLLFPQQEDIAVCSCYCFLYLHLNCWIVDELSLGVQEMIENDRWKD